jgi:hypothetical protein
VIREFDDGRIRTPMHGYLHGMRYLTIASAVLAGGITLAPHAAADDVAQFVSPSGNIGCIMMPDLARCDIKERDWEPPPRPADCPDVTGYGQGVQVSDGGRPTVVCAGDTALSEGPALPYGQSRWSGKIVCTSEIAGIRCRNPAGHGFTISREAYSFF